MPTTTALIPFRSGQLCAKLRLIVLVLVTATVAMPTSASATTRPATPTHSPALLPLAPHIRVCPGDIQLGETIQCFFNQTSDVRHHFLTATAGDRIIIRMTSSTFWPGYRFFDEDGVEVTSCMGGGIPGTIERQCILPKTGVYRIRTYVSWLGTGIYFFFVERLNRTPAKFERIAYNQEISRTLYYSAEVGVTVFPATIGDKIILKMTTSGFWPGFRVFDAEGLEVPACAAGGIPPTLERECTLPSSGLFRILTYESFSGADIGTYRLRLDCLLAACGFEDKARRPLVLIYAGLDNDLADDSTNWDRIVNNSESGVHPGVTVRLFIDGPGDNNSFVYDIQPDDRPNCPNLSNPTCDGRYMEGVNFWRVSEDSAHPDTLIAFAKAALTQYATATHVVLVLAGHGSGWAANGLPAQPSRYKPQPGVTTEVEERVGGLLWDDSPGNSEKSRALSTRALGAALAWIKADTGRAIDMLYFDACSMGMTEVAYEVRNSAKYMLASANTDWATFAYDDALRSMRSDLSAYDIAERWMTSESQTLLVDKYPFTQAIYDLGKMDALAVAASNFANVLSATLTSTVQIEQANLAAERYEMIYDNVITRTDSYVDDRSFAARILAAIPGNSVVISAAKSLSDVMDTVVVTRQIQSGVPWTYPASLWQWSESKGLSIYLPANRQDEARRALYTASNLQWAKDTTWDEYLAAYMASITPVVDSASDQLAQSAQVAAELPTCDSTRQCALPKSLPLQIKPRAYEPVVMRSAESSQASTEMPCRWICDAFNPYQACIMMCG